MAKQYWLFKTEPDCFSIEDLRQSPGMTTSWSGVRNYLARNILRDQVKVKDEVLFHHSSSDPVGIAGTCVVTRSGYPDPTQFDPESQYFAPKATLDSPIWYTVDVKFQLKLSELIPLSLLRQTPGLEKMMVCQRGARLSVQPVTAEEWRVVQALIKKTGSIT
ncbi:MAG: EVE domain-containing protein [candidate division Zixibacteria bacterium]|nr:EVE domain-containing protein [candidate division Zixibacteria bacterium]